MSRDDKWEEAKHGVDGWEMAYSEEGSGEHFFGLKIFVKMSNRKICDKDDFYRVADEIKKNLQTVSAELDPEGPAERESYRQQVAEIYKTAGVEAIFMEALPNGYCDRPCCLNKPWFLVTSRIGRVVMLRRPCGQ